MPVSRQQPEHEHSHPRHPDEFDRELAFHLEELTQTYIAQGMNAREARRQASLDFGGHTQIKQAIRDVHLSRWIEAVRFQAKAALRFLQHAPGLSVAVVLTLGLGIGANSAMFSVLDAVILHPLPYPASDDLVVLTQHNDLHDANVFVAPSRLEDWNRLSTSFQAISGWYKDDLTETSGALPERLTMALIAPRFLTVMGVSPLLGRDFLPAEEHFGSPQAALISYSFWQRHFHADPDVLGKQLHAGRWNMPIIGVMPASFLYPDRGVDLWTVSPPDAPYAQRRDETWFTAIGRLKPGTAPALGRANLATVQHALGLQFPATDADLRVELTPLKELTIANIRASVWLLYGSVSLLLLIACSNIAALLLARTADRQHEISIRFSLGASRRTIILQLLAETFTLSLFGSLLGLAIAGLVTHVFHLLAGTLPRAEEIALNGRIVLYSLLCAIGTTLLCGLYPAVRGTRRQLAHSLAGTSRTQTAARHPMQWVLVGVQVTLAVVLLTGAGLLVRSLQELSRVSPGFDAAHVLTFQVTGSYGETADMGRLSQRINRTLEALRALPGVTAAATSVTIPGMPGKYQDEYRRDGQKGPTPGTTDGKILAESRTVSDGYFNAMSIPVLLGKSCSATPARLTSQGEYVINRSFAARYFPNGSPLGHTLAVAASGGLYPHGPIVGVVADAREGGLNTAPQPTAYACFNAPDPAPIFLVRTPGDPTRMADAIRRELRELEPGRSVYAIVPLREHLDSAFSENRLRTVVLVSFAGTAVLLACIGLYGTLSYLARIRHREVGVRLTLGASRAQVASLFLGQGLRVTAVGCMVGAAASLVTTRLLATMLYGISPLDLRTWLSVLLFTLFAAVIACAIPAHRAAQVEPVEALRAG